MRFSVIGAGNGGRAFAAYLSSKGFSVNLYNRSYSRIADIKKKGGIRTSGILKGFFPIDLVTQDLELAVKNADIILVVVAASAHKEISEKLAPYLSNDQIILLNPGRTFGAVEFRRILEKNEINFPIFIGETQTLLFTSRQQKKNGVDILKIKELVDFAAFPDKDTFYIYDTLKDVFPQLNPVEDYLEMTLNNIGMLLHPTISILNAGAMDSEINFKFYVEGATNRVCEVLENVQLELNEIFEFLGLKQFRFCNWVDKSYGVKKRRIYDAIQSIKAYENINAPNQLITRYFTEDIPTGLVPVSSLAKFLGLETPLIDSIINLSSILCGINFKNEGRTIKGLCLENFIKKRISNDELIDLAKMQKILVNN
ncbi:MAG: NAD/NADP octopine/nopaline dehydrogenase family protein [Candidatus Heimdallarchaeota archaeon]